MSAAISVGAAVLIGAGVAAVGGIAAAEISSSGAQKAASIQAAASMNAQQLQYSEFLTQQQNLAPYLSAGTNALANLQKGAQPGGAYNAPFTLSQFQQDPGYNFTKAQGQAGINAGAAGRGMSGTPAAAEATSAFNQNLSSLQYQSAYNNYVNRQNQGFNQQLSLANIGTGAVAQSNAAAQNYANNAGSLIVGAGNAEAAAQVASSNAFGGALNSIGNNALSLSLFNSLKTNTTGGTAGGSGAQFTPQDLQTYAGYQTDYANSGGLMQVPGGYTVNLPPPT